MVVTSGSEGFPIHSRTKSLTKVGKMKKLRKVEKEEMFRDDEEGKNVEKRVAYILESTKTADSFPNPQI